jgi:hypothetical protein
MYKKENLNETVTPWTIAKRVGVMSFLLSLSLATTAIMIARAVGY